MSILSTQSTFSSPNRKKSSTASIDYIVYTAGCTQDKIRKGGSSGKQVLHPMGFIDASLFSVLSLIITSAFFLIVFHKFSDRIDIVHKIYQIQILAFFHKTSIRFAMRRQSSTDSNNSGITTYQGVLNSFFWFCSPMAYQHSSFC